MNRSQQSFIALLTILLCLPLNATTIVRGNDPASPFGFTTAITTKVFDRTTGMFFVGLSINSTNPTNAFTISQATRPTFTTSPQFIGIAPTTPSLQNLYINYLTLSPQLNAAPILGVVATPLSTITALPTDGTTAQQVTVKDAGGINAGTIVNLAANSNYFFAPLYPSGGSFGTGNSGVALVSITKDSAGNTILTTKDATTGLDGNKAQILNSSSTPIIGDSGGGPVIFSTATGDVNMVATHYDEYFERLYLGLRITTTCDTCIAKAVVVGLIGNTGQLVLEKVVADGAIVSGTTANNVIVAQNMAGQSQNLSILNIRTMHASTGPSFLIVNGGKNTTNMVSNLIYALPLVDDPTNVSAHGTLADITQFNAATHTYMTPATMLGTIFDVSTDPVQQNAAIVGTTALPMLPSDQVYDMVVVGDTVYVSIATDPTTFVVKPASLTNDTGIFYSQALFNDVGEITRWTPWVKQAAPVNAFPLNLPSNIPHDGPISFFDIDAATGNVWIVDGTQFRVVGVTSWSNTNASSTNNMISSLNNLCTQVCTPQAKSCKSKGCSQIDCCCCSVLDLHQGTRGFTSTSTTTPYRYALFGINDSVVFTLISTATATISNTNTPQTVTNDFSNPANFLQTTLPAGAGCCRVLEYSRRKLSDSPPQNFFFAGTNTGLFVFAQPDGSGTPVNLLGLLNSTPFTTGSWQKINTINGAVIDIKTSGNRLYVLTFEVINDPKTPIINKLLAFNFAANIATMFGTTPPTVLAQTKTNSPFGSIQEFFSMHIISTGDPGSNPTGKEQLILATNQGLFKSNADQSVGNGIINANNQTDAAWTVIPNSATTMFLTIAGIDNEIDQTIWPISVEDKNNCKSFARGGVYQLSGQGTTNIINTNSNTAAINTFVPADFNALNQTPPFQTLNPTTYLWSDGGRRIFITKSINDPAYINHLTALPFDVDQWNITSQHPIADPALDRIDHFYWVKQIGLTGMVLAGTNRGIIGLQ